MNGKKKDSDGFSLVEMLIAIAITSIVLTALIALLSYTMRSANQTRARIALQNEAKDAVNHICGYVMEGNHVTWKDDKKLLVVEKDVTEGNKLKKKEWYYYYLLNGKLFFKNVSSGENSITEDKKHLMAEHVEVFEVKPDEVNEKVVHVKVKLHDTVSEIECKQDVHIRNLCKGGGVHDS